MEQEQPLIEQSGGDVPSQPLTNTNFTSEAFRIEPRDVDRPTNLNSLDTSLSNPQSQSNQNYQSLRGRKIILLFKSQVWY